MTEKQHDLEIVRNNMYKLQMAFVDYATAVLNGKKAPKLSNMQNDYEEMYCALCRLFGVEETHNKPPCWNKQLAEGAYQMLIKKGIDPYYHGYRE